jgi:hypothetical protein
MPISDRDNPDQRPGIVKFIGSDGTGHRGAIVAIESEGSHAILIGATGEHWGKLLLVREIRPENYPKFVRYVTEVPNTKDWELRMRGVLAR